MQPIYAIFAGILGLAVSNLLTRYIYRIPAEEPCHTASKCDHCGTALSWRHIIPLLSQKLQKGRSACCNAILESQYPSIEILAAVLPFILWLTNPPLQAAIYTVITWALIVMTFIDINHLIIPDRISLGGIPLGLGLSYALPSLQGETSRTAAFLASTTGTATGALLLIGVMLLGTFLFKKESMGMGDVKYMAAVGACFGWKAILFILPAGALLGSIVGGMALMRDKNKSHILAFGPYLAIATYIWMIGGNHIIDWYMAYVAYCRPPQP